MWDCLLFVLLLVTSYWLLVRMFHFVQSSPSWAEQWVVWGVRCAGRAGRAEHSKMLVETVRSVLPAQSAQSVADYDEHSAVPPSHRHSQGWKRADSTEENCQPLHTVTFQEGPQQGNPLEHWQVRPGDGGDGGDGGGGYSLHVNWITVLSLPTPLTINTAYALLYHWILRPLVSSIVRNS